MHKKLEKLFEPRPVRRLVIIAVPIIIIVFLTIFTQYIMFFPVKSSSAMPWLLLIGLIIGVPLGYKFRLKKRRGIALAAVVVIGFMLVPYTAFMFGQIHVFMVDDDMPSYMQVIEVRPTTDRIVWVEKDAGDVIVYQGPKTLYLHPGENRVYFGTMNIPAGTYTSGINYMSNIEVDIEVDLVAAGVSAENYSQRYQEIQQWEGEQATNWNINGAIVTYTYNTGPKEDHISWGGEFSYPGFGGPDITLDIVLGSDGRPISVTPIFDTPPGISMESDEVHDFGDL
jgi:hypothetical protein